MISEKYNEENTKKVQELTKKIEKEFARRNDFLTKIDNLVVKANKKQTKELLSLLKESKPMPVEIFKPFTEDEEKSIIRGVFELLIERAQSVIASGYEGLGVQDLKDLAFNEYGIDMEGKNEQTF